jgi:hypothetical protein
MYKESKKQEQAGHDFTFHRLGNSGKIVVSNSLSYTMAEYDEKTGLTRWQRVVPAAQREKIQHSLLANYPIQVERSTAKVKTRRAVAA